MRRRVNDDEEPLLESAADEEPPWNLFKHEPRKVPSGSTMDTSYVDFGIKFLKFATLFVTFTVVLGSAVFSKGTLLLMTSQVKKTTRLYCNKNIDTRQQFVVSLPDEERAVWIWLIIFAYFVPEMGTFVRSMRIIIFKSWKFPDFLREILPLLVTESLTAIGSALLVFAVLPELDVIKGAMLTNAMCLVPSILAFVSGCFNFSEERFKVLLDFLAMISQATALFAWFAVDNKKILLCVIPSILLISLGWWNNFISDEGTIEFLKKIREAKKEFKTSTYFTYSIIAPLKCILFFCATLLIFWMRDENVDFLFDKFTDAFSTHFLNVSEIEPIVGTSGIDYKDAVASGYGVIKQTSVWTPLSVWFINIATTYICYAFGKFACKILIQTSGFALPLNLVVPVLLTVLIAMCGNYNKDECAYAGTIPPYLFFNTPSLTYLEDFITHQHPWIWLAWLLSQTWITIHIWTSYNKKLASTEMIFLRPMYDAFLVDQSITMNRRRQKEEDKDKEKEKQIEDIDLADEEDNKQIDDEVTRIYACGTMWHENKEEMVIFLKSIFKLDIDQCAHRLVKERLKYKMPDYYEIETHIFFDDAFIRYKNDPEPHLNMYVNNLIESMSVAASEVHETNVRIKPPVIYPTPYGGRLVWILPGKTKFITHLKDKAKIRAKKRWSQVMYMYYLLGFRIMDNEAYNASQIKNLSKNTYILALDGDIDFEPQAVHLLVDYMRKNDTLGAVCGRIHPVGTGLMAWYQVFEYAVGHWLQKATEHVIGCVLCSPGCFSLFRAGALMDDNVMAKYTTVSSEARHHVQYDQGEDRWLCTLLLQRGYRVEYSAASDAYTHCPEGFNEFYNQRRRWMPSTTANILDLLADYKYIVKKNDNISKMYILYQAFMMIGSVIGPGTILLMLVGAFVAAFHMSQWEGFLYNAAPILVFVVICSCCSSNTQLFFAGIISIIYALVMMTVLVGVIIQIEYDGFLAPSSLFLFLTFFTFVIAAILHPQEFYCLKYGLIYYITIPSMYMLLVIYSVFNMDNVSWGTRDVTVVEPEKKSDNEGDKEKKEEVKEKKEASKDKVYSFFGNNSDNAGSIEFSFAGLFKILCFTYQKNAKEEEILRNIQNSLTQLQQKLDRIQNNEFNTEISSPSSSVSSTPTIPIHLDGSSASRVPRSNDVPKNDWFYEDKLNNSRVDFLDIKEEAFWDKFIGKYLKPIDDKNADVTKSLKDLRDTMVITFFVLNAIFVLVIFLLNIQQDIIHLDWPINPKINFTYIYDENEVVINETPLRLQPIGFLFLLSFALVMVIQFIAMIIHRFGTYCQIMANTNVSFNLCDTKNLNDITEKEILKRDPINIVKKLFKLHGINEEQDTEESPVGKRNTTYILAMKKDKIPKPVIEDLEKAFNARLDKIKNEGNVESVNIRKKTQHALVTRVEDIHRRKTELLNNRATSRN